MTNIFTILLHSISLAVLLALSHTLLKWVSIQKHSSYIELLMEHWLTIGLALSLYGAIFFYYIFVLKTNPISILYPTYTGLSILFVLAAAHLFFKEPISHYQISGVCFIIIGVYLTTKQT